MARRRYQQGSVVLLPSKRWILRWREDVIQEDGSIRRVSRKTSLGTLDEIPTKKLARREAEPILAKINAREYRAGRFITLSDFWIRWDRDALAMLKASTQRTARSYYRTHIHPALGNLRLDEVDQQSGQAFVASLSRKLKRKTIANVMGVIGAMIASAKSWGYSVGSLRAEELILPREEVREERPTFTAEEIRKILEASSGKWLALYATFALTGARSGEVFALSWDDVDFTRGIIFIRRSNWRGTIQTVKTARSRRVLPMPGALAQILRDFYAGEWEANAAGWLFAGPEGLPLKPEAALRWRLHPLLKRLGIKRAGFHAFRHTQSSLLISTGANPKVAQAQLGHSDIRTTLELYSHVIAEDHRAAVERVAGVLRPDVSDVQMRALRVN